MSETCKTCGGEYQGPLRHSCTVVLLKKIAQLREYKEVVETKEDQLEARVKELVLQVNDLEEQVVDQRKQIKKMRHNAEARKMHLTAFKDAAEAMLELEARCMYERSPDTDVTGPEDCPCSACVGLRKAVSNA